MTVSRAGLRAEVEVPTPVSGPATGKARFQVGTSGYSHADWIEAGFYPPETPSGRLLGWYARRFPVVELNQTAYRMPRPEDLEHHLGQTPAEFGFAVKLPRTQTHQPPTEGWKEQIAAFRHGIAPLIQAGRLIAVLVQFPVEFDRSVAHRRRLAELLDELDGLPLAVEFRQGSWHNDRVLAELERRGVTLVAVDAPRLPGLFPPLDVVTNPDLAYLRFHGRNIRGWRQENHQTQFDYNYWESELEEWIDTRIARMADRVPKGVIFFTNHVRAQAPQNAEIMARLLAAHGF